MNVDELIAEGKALFEDWFSSNNVEESHVRSMYLMAYPTMLYMRHAPDETRESELALRMTAVMFAAYQMGRAARE